MSFDGDEAPRMTGSVDAGAATVRFGKSTFALNSSAYAITFTVLSVLVNVLGTTLPLQKLIGSAYARNSGVLSDANVFGALRRGSGR